MLNIRSDLNIEYNFQSTAFKIVFKSTNPLLEIDNYICIYIYNQIVFGN